MKPEPKPREKKIEPPAIIVTHLNVSSFVRHMKEKSIDVKISNSKSTSTVKVCALDQYNKVKEYLHDHKYEYHSFTHPNERKTILELKGIHGSHNDQDVTDALLHEFEIKGIATASPDKITVRTLKKASEERQNNIYIVSVDNELSIPQVLKIGYLLGQRIYWQRFHNKNVAQCKKCQQFLHAAHNCERKYRCVKCIEDHEPGKCPRTDPKEGKPQCVNCRGDHPASYKGCPVHKAVLKTKKEKLQQQTPTTTSTNHKS